MIPERWLREVRSVPERGIRLVKGDGVFLWDDEDRQYLDLGVGGGVNLVGHANAAVDTAISSQLAAVSSAHPGFELDARQEFIEALSVLMPEALTDVMFSDSGAGAVALAARIASLVTGREAVVDYRLPPAGSNAPRPVIDRQVAGVIVEALSLGAAAIEPIDLSALAKRCRQAGALLIVDETRTSLRAGSWLASAADGVTPDIVCLGNSVANGLPVGATVTRSEHARKLRRAPLPADQGSAVSFAAGAATLQIAAGAQLQTHARIVGDHLLSRLRALRLPEIREVRGRGLAIAMVLRHHANAVVRGLQQRGILALGAGDGVVRLMPPLVIEKRQADDVVEALAGVIVAGRRARHRGDEADVEISLPGVASGRSRAPSA